MPVYIPESRALKPAWTKISAGIFSVILDAFT